jgi:Nucleotidyltransferase domain.
MDLARPYAAVAPTVEGDVLVALAHTSRPLTGREVAKLARRGTQPSVQRALNQLALHGLVHTQEAGRAILYTLNRDHIAYPAVELLADLRKRFFDRLRSLVAGWQLRPVHASVFGSAARGDGGQDSDIDVFIVRPPTVDEDGEIWRSQLVELQDSVRQWTGNHASISEVPLDEVARLSRTRPAIVGDLERDAVLLAGVSPTKLFGKKP